MRLGPKRLIFSLIFFLVIMNIMSIDPWFLFIFRTRMSIIPSKNNSGGVLSLWNSIFNGKVKQNPYNTAGHSIYNCNCPKFLDLYLSYCVWVIHTAIFSQRLSLFSPLCIVYINTVHFLRRGLSDCLCFLHSLVPIVCTWFVLCRALLTLTL